MKSSSKKRSKLFLQLRLLTDILKRTREVKLEPDAKPASTIPPDPTAIEQSDKQSCKRLVGYVIKVEAAAHKHKKNID